MENKRRHISAATICEIDRAIDKIFIIDFDRLPRISTKDRMGRERLLICRDPADASFRSWHKIRIWPVVASIALETGFCTSNQFRIAIKMRLAQRGVRKLKLCGYEFYCGIRFR
jgi:hypothetical protein